MSKYKKTATVINGLLQFLIAGGILSATLVAPNALQAFDKPLRLYFKRMDRQKRDKEYRRLLRYMEQQGLIEHRAASYQHGIRLTETGRKRAEKADIDHLSIAKPSKWDKKWRIVLFDIPESYKTARNALDVRLGELGFAQLQKSVWVHPFPCREEIAAIVEQYEIRKFVTYIETSYIDAKEKLIDRFDSLLK